MTQRTQATVAPPPASSIPALYAFDSRLTDWDSYRDRIKFYFKASRIDDDNEKKALFLWSVGDATYHLLNSLVSPTELTSDELTFAALIDLLDVHFDAKKNIMTATYDFYSCAQKPGQSFAEWKAELCDKMRHCGFTTSVLRDKPQHRALRDMYVMGVCSQKTRLALLKEQDPNLETVERLIQRAERLEADVRHFASAAPVNELTVAAVHRSQPRQYPARPVKSSSPPAQTTCLTCGSAKHVRSECKLRDLLCHHCGRKGHLQRVCRQKHNGPASTNYIETIFQVQSAPHRARPHTDSTTVPLTVNGRKLHFELDTGTLNTIVAMEDWRKLNSPKIHASNLALKCYGGTPLTVRGECTLQVTHDDRVRDLPVVIVNGSGPSLLGLHWIRALQLDLNQLVHRAPVPTHAVHHVFRPDRLSSLLQQFPNVLNDQLGHCTQVQAHIELNPTASPRFFKPRALPFAYSDGVKAELQRNVDLGILQPVTTSRWATPIVAVRKQNGSFRICGDFKVTLNSQMLVDQYPIPLIDELFTRLNKGQHFTKLDLSDAYLQLELDDSSKELTVINTPFGLFRYNRMPFGIANAPAVFQKTIDQVLAGIDNCIAYLDDILITGPTDDEHLKTLELVLRRLSAFGLTCKLNKCLFFQSEVTYLGFIVDKHGKRPDSSRVDAILHMPAPTNVKQVEAFVGKVNYYGQFIPNFSDKCAPLNRLRQSHVDWDWTPDCQRAFEGLLNDISSATSLVHFDNRLPLVLATDASNHGIGAVLSHRYPDHSERPIAHASKTLTAAERNYSQIEKEALAIVYGIKKFHKYLAGRSFELLTDHKPLLSIFNPDKALPLSTTGRIQRWAILLMGYRFTIRYKPTHLHANADALSRLPTGPDDSFVDRTSEQVNFLQRKLLNDSLVDATAVATATEHDPTLQQVTSFVTTKWPSSVPKSHRSELTPYFNSRHCLSLADGCLLKGSQVIIPSCLREQVLRMLHRTHLGTVKMKQLARAHCWWPGIDRDIEQTTRSCPTCAQLHPSPPRRYQSWEDPLHVWSRVHVDFAGPVWNSKWLIMIDAKSKFPLVLEMPTDTTAGSLRHALDNVFDWFGPPATLVSDNGPPFTSHDMNEFYRHYGITHVTTSPYHPASNGIAERLVRSFKESLAKQQHTGQTNKYAAVRDFLRTYRWTPHTSTGVCPANMMFQHSVRTEWDRLKPPPSPVSRCDPQFHVGQLIWALKFSAHKRPQWQPAIVTRSRGSVVCDVTFNDGIVAKRHVNQLRLRHSSPRSASAGTSLPDDLLSSASSAPPVPPPHHSPRYPTRTRKPPDRYSPSKHT